MDKSLEIMHSSYIIKYFVLKEFEFSRTNSEILSQIIQFSSALLMQFHFLYLQKWTPNHFALWIVLRKIFTKMLRKLKMFPINNDYSII